MASKTKLSTKYCWYNDANEVCDWSLSLFEPAALARSIPDKKLPFRIAKREQNTAEHIIEIETFPEKILSTHYKNIKPHYNGQPVDAGFVLGYMGDMDWEFRAEAYLLRGEFKTGLVTASRAWVQTAREFRNNLSQYFHQTPTWDLPPFGDALQTFFNNSNLPQKYKKAFRGLFE